MLFESFPKWKWHTSCWSQKKITVPFYSESTVLAFLKLMVKSCWGCIWNRRQLPVTSFMPVCECFIVSVYNSVFAVSLFFVSNSFAENCYTMPVVNLNGFDFEGRFDSSIPTSLVSSSTAFRLKSLDAVTVTCHPLDDCYEIRCVLNFTIKEGLESDCVLGTECFSRNWGDIGAFLFFCCVSI